MASVSDTSLRRAENLRINLRRIFSAWAVQVRTAQDAGIHPVHLARILSGTNPNPTIETIERLSIALELPIEILLAANPADSDLRIFPRKPAKAS